MCFGLFFLAMFYARILGLDCIPHIIAQAIWQSIVESISSADFVLSTSHRRYFPTKTTLSLAGARIVTFSVQDGTKRRSMWCLLRK